VKRPKTTDPIRKGFRTVTPYLFAQNASHLIEFIAKAFEGSEVSRKERPDGAIIHAEVRIGDSMLMLGEATPQFGAMPTSIFVRRRFGQRLPQGARGRRRLRVSHHDPPQWGTVWRRQGCLRKYLVDCHSRGRRVARGRRETLERIQNAINWVSLDATRAACDEALYAPSLRKTSSNGEAELGGA
jgi:hypothetical protein